VSIAHLLRGDIRPQQADRRRTARRPKQVNGAPE
jgi:hypothetical protein